jgi:DNA-binding NtrC family response regulator
MPTTFLVVDDEVLIRWSTVNNLEDMGYRVLEAATAREAIALLENYPEIKLVFTDVRMPGTMDGMGLVAEVQKKWPAIKLFVTSGYPLNSDLPKGATYIPKPYSVVRLNQIFTDALFA